MGWEDIAPETPAWRQEFSACKDCDRLEIEVFELRKQYTDSCSESDSLLSEVKNLEAKLKAEQQSVDELSLANQDLTNALKQIYELGDNTGSHMSWHAVYEEARNIAQKALQQVKIKIGS